MKVFDCEKNYDDLIDFFEGEIPADQAKIVREHLSGCARCQEALKDYQFIRRAMREDVSDPGDFYFTSLNARVIDRINSGEAEPFWTVVREWLGRRVFRPAALAPVAGILLAALVVFGNPWSSPLPSNGEEMNRIAKEVRVYSPVRQLHLLPISYGADSYDDGNGVAGTVRTGFEKETSAALKEMRGLTEIAASFSEPESEMTEKDLMDLKDCVDDAFESWSI